MSITLKWKKLKQEDTEQCNVQTSSFFVLNTCLCWILLFMILSKQVTYLEFLRQGSFASDSWLPYCTLPTMGFQGLCLGDILPDTSCVVLALPPGRLPSTKPLTYFSFERSCWPVPVLSLNQKLRHCEAAL